MSFENTVAKGEITRKEQFLLFPHCFLLVLGTFCHFHRIWNCRLQTLSVWKSLKFVVWERVKPRDFGKGFSVLGDSLGRCRLRLVHSDGALLILHNNSPYGNSFITDESVNTPLFQWNWVIVWFCYKKEQLTLCGERCKSPPLAAISWFLETLWQEDKPLITGIFFFCERLLVKD